MSRERGRDAGEELTVRLRPLATPDDLQALAALLLAEPDGRQVAPRVDPASLDALLAGAVPPTGLTLAVRLVDEPCLWASRARFWGAQPARSRRRHSGWRVTTSTR